MNAVLWLLALTALLPTCVQGRENSTERNKLTYHNNPQRTGWNARETVLTPQTVAAGSFGRIWRTAAFESFNGLPPRLFASPLFVDRVAIASGEYKGRHLSIVYAVTTTGYAYAVNAFAAGDTPPGAILWRVRLTDKPCFKGSFGNLSTPVIDVRTQRLYVTSCDDQAHWRAHALDIRSGREAAGWPVSLDSASVSGVNKNGHTEFGDKLSFQRGALNLSPDGTRLYITFAGTAEFANGWIVAIETRLARVATAFSSTARTAEVQGGMWASGGPSVDSQGNVYIATGANSAVVAQKLGIKGIYPDSAHNWGQSIIRLRDDARTGFELVGTYTPFNYCQAAAADIDLGSGGTVVIDLDPSVTATPRLLALGGVKQGNVHLLDRLRMPGGLIKRAACSTDSASDGSLLSPDVQPQFRRRGPVNVFGPYTEDRNMENQAKGRSTPAYFRDARGKHYLFVTGSAKTGENLTVSTPPGLARLEIVTKPMAPAYLRIDQLERTQIFHNPGSPIVTSDGGKNAIVWVLDENAVRTAPLYGPDTPKPVLYAFDASSLTLLWKSAPGQLATSGKYNEPTAVRGTVFVGTDRIEAFALGAPAMDSVPEPVVVETTPAAIEAVPTQVDGASLFAQRCAACHNSGQAEVPTQQTLSKLAHEKIVFALQYGAMQTQAFGLSEAEIGALAAYLRSTNDPCN